MTKLFGYLSGTVCMGYLYWLVFDDYKFSNGWSFFYISTHRCCLGDNSYEAF